MAANDVTIIGNSFDALKFRTPSGKAVPRVAATLAERDDFTRFLPAQPASDGLSHKVLRTISLPTGYLVDIGGSWKSSKAEFEPGEEGLFTVRSTYQCPTSVYENVEKDVGMAKLKANRVAHVMAINQGVTNMMVEGTTAPNQSAIAGLMKRPPWTTYDNKFCFSAGGSGDDLRSCWLMKPGVDTLYALYNKNHPTLGVEEKDKGEQLITGLGTNSDEHRYDIMIEFMIQKGICVEDMRALKRICNVACGTSDYPGIDLVNWIIEASIINAPTGGTMFEYNSAGAMVAELPSPWLLMCDERLYAKLVLSGNDRQVVVSDANNIFRTKLPRIGDNIIVCRMDALNHDIGSGESSVSAA